LEHINRHVHVGRYKLLYSRPIFVMLYILYWYWTFCLLFRNLGSNCIEKHWAQQRTS